MDQGATAPATPAANRKGMRALWRAGLCALSLQTAMAATAAAGMPATPGSAVSEIQRLALTQASTVEHLPAQLHFSAAPAARAVSPVRISLLPAATPKLKPQPPAPAVTTAALPGPTRADDLKPTFLLNTRGQSVGLTPVSTRWQRALGELENDAADTGRHTYRAYAAILDQVRDTSRSLQIPRVNYMVNRLLAYRDDVRLWNSGEYWASPAEALEKRAGDCEDYAILKYALLRDVGVRDADMRIVVLMDTAARQHHAVLAVRHDGAWLILDNRFSRVRFERDLPNYKPLYSVNASGEWSHIPQTGNPVRLAARLKSATK